jgi:chemotaxis protein CheD
MDCVIEPRLEIVGIGEMKVSSDPDVTLITYSLGSCLGVALHDPKAGVAGLIHCMLPMSRMDVPRSERQPALFVDTGVLKLMQTLLNLGAQKRRLVVKVAGCGAPLDTNGQFKIGERNYAVLRKVLWKNDLLIESEDVGGDKPRTLSIRPTDGYTTVRSRRETVEL